MSSPFSKAKINKRMARLADEMIDIPFGDITCANCSKNVGKVGIKGIGLKFNAQHVGDLAIEVQCPHCSASFELHYRKFATSLKNFAVIILALGIDKPFWPLGPALLTSNITPSMNNLLDIMSAELKDKQTKIKEG